MDQGYKMKKEDLDFRKSCQAYHKEIRKFLKNAKYDEADSLIHKIGESLKAWEGERKSINFRINILKSLFTTVVAEEKRIIKRS